MPEDFMISGDSPSIPIHPEVVNSDEKSSGDSHAQPNIEPRSYEELLKAGQFHWNKYRGLRDEGLAMLSTKRKELIAKRQWSAFVETLEGMKLKTLNSHLDAFEANGNKKADRLIKRVVVDDSRTVVIITGAKLVGDELILEIRHYKTGDVYQNRLRIA
jgi:hypothetical protein